MPFQPGHKFSPGRRKGSINNRSVPLRQKAEELGIDPFSVLLLFAGGRYKELGYSSASEIQPPVRARAAAESAQYLYPKLKQVEQIKENQWKNLPVDQQLAAAKQLVQVLEDEVKNEK